MPVEMEQNFSSRMKAEAAVSKLTACSKPTLGSLANLIAGHSKKLSVDSRRRRLCRHAVVRVTTAEGSARECPLSF